jgi:hypothetical protein
MLFLAAVLVLIGIAVGSFRGAARALGLAIALILALLLSLPLGRLLGHAVTLVSGITGLNARFLGVAVAAIVIVASAMLAIGIPVRRWMKSRPEWKKWDRIAGAGLGAFEGAILALAILWIPQALEPIARAQVREAEESGQAPPAAATRITALAQSVRDSSLASVAAATNPVAGSDLLGLAGDFSQISRDPAAVDQFMHTDAMQRVQALPSVTKAIELLQDDPQLRALSDGQGVSVDAIRAILESPTVLRIFDETTIVNDLSPLGNDLRAAIKETKAKMSARPSPNQTVAPPPKRP